jgi:non-ribosomal peptide synthetase component F
MISDHALYFSHLKAQFRHQNFTKSIQSLSNADTFNENDTVVQMSRCSFDIHVQEILGALINGATIVILRPRGTLDFEYLSTVLHGKQITYINSVPSLFHSFFRFVEDYNKKNVVKYLKRVCSGGMYFTKNIVYS